MEGVTSIDVHADHDPGLAWLTARLRWERTLEGLRLHRSVAVSPCREQERPAA